MAIWAQLMNDCPPVLSLGILCTKQGWTYEWQNGKLPILSKGTKMITLTPNHDVPMIFAARTETQNVNMDEARAAADSIAAGSDEGRPSASQNEESTSEPLHGDQPSASSSGEEPPAVARPKAKSKGPRQKQRFVKSKYSRSPSVRHNQITHFPLDMNCEICKLVKCTRAACKAN